MEETEDRWDERTPYTWSKVQGERFVHLYLPQAAILRLAVVWGDERNRKTASPSVPFQLANHSLEYLFNKYTRRYVHATDVAEAVRNCLVNNHKGVYSVAPNVFWNNHQLADLVEWDDYEWVSDPREVGFPHIISHRDTLHAPKIPGWSPEIGIQDELPRLEKYLTERGVL